MPVTIESTVFIARPLEEVFAFVLDLEKSAATDPNLVSVVKTSEGPIGVGTTFVLRQNIQGRLRESVTRLSGIEPNRRIDFDADLGPISPHMSFAFERVEGGTRVTVQGGGTPRGLFKLLSRRIQRMGQHAWDERLRHIKVALEAPRSEPDAHVPSGK
jgi:carbon monoxide dehydrogenase subunit G